MTLAPFFVSIGATAVQVFVPRFDERLSFKRFGLEVVLWSRSLLFLQSPGPLVPCFPSLVSWSCAPLVLWLLGPVLLRSRGFFNSVLRRCSGPRVLWFLWDRGQQKLFKGSKRNCLRDQKAS